MLKIFKKKKQQGIRFYGWGSKSLWTKIGFHKTIHLKTLKQYNDFFGRRWLLKFLWDIRLFGPFFNSPIWISLQLTKPEDFDQAEIDRSQSVNLNLIAKEVKSHLSKAVKRSFKDDTYILRGMELTQEDYYYILEDQNGKRCYETCVGGLNYIGD